MNISHTKIFAKHDNQIAEAINNLGIAPGFKPLYAYPKFKSLSKDKGYGRLMFHIYENPGLTRKQIRQNLSIKAQCAEMFQNMNSMKLIYNIRGKGYFITDLGIAILAKFNFI
jgi:hypothetical protein